MEERTHCFQFKADHVQMFDISPSWWPLLLFHTADFQLLQSWCCFSVDSRISVYEGVELGAVLWRVYEPKWLSSWRHDGVGEGSDVVGVQDVSLRVSHNGNPPGVEVVEGRNRELI
jgi:hypothetical protein